MKPRENQQGKRAIYSFPFQKRITVTEPNQSFPLELGGQLDEVVVGYESYGTLNQAKDNVVLLFHGLSGDSHGAAHTKGDQPGWWEPMIGVGKVLDTSRFFILVPNVLGGSQGTTGPLSINSATGKIYGPDFPKVTIRDMVAANRKLLDQLEIEAPFAVIGGSMGGMLALEWAAMYPADGARIISMVAPERASAQAIGYSHVMRRAIEQDPAWQGGYYDPQNQPRAGLETARAIGMLIYQTEEMMEKKFGTTKREDRWEVEHYLEYQGEKLAERFDANTYLTLLSAMDSYDLSANRTNYPELFQRKRGKMLLIGNQGDLFYGLEHQQALAEKIALQGASCKWIDLGSLHGHDGFLIDFKLLEPILRKIL